MRHLPHLRISNFISLSYSTGGASGVTPLSSPHYVVWLGFTTFWRSTVERNLRGLWGCCVRTFHLFHQVLGWLSCLRSPTTRHAVVPRRGFTGLRFPFFTCHCVDTSLLGSVVSMMMLPPVSGISKPNDSSAWLDSAHLPSTSEVPHAS